MKEEILSFLKEKYDMDEVSKIENIENDEFFDFLYDIVKLAEPSRIFIVTETSNDYEYVRRKALEYGEERVLKNANHTYHFDNYYDQARDKENTKILVENGPLSLINTMERSKGIEEVRGLMKGIMKDREMFVGFFVLGTKNSEFTIPTVQITDSAYVMHSELILYRNAYEYFVKNQNLHFLRFVHSQGELDERKTSKNLEKRRIYFDIEGETSYSINNQYAGNSVGLKKNALRLTIAKALKEGWLSEHMFLMGVNGPDGRVTYFTGAFPSMCGKTSTCMIPHERLVGDDLSFIKVKDGKAYAVNVENGVFGIIEDINEKDDPLIWKVLFSDNEVIFSNILVYNGKPYWNGMGIPIPDKGENHSGLWWKGKKDKEGKEIPPSHKNARFTVKLERFPNLDRWALDNPEGVELGGIIYGGRDSDTWPPVCEAFNWDHGVINKGASIESETTAATIGKEGVRTFNPMSIIEFLSVDIGKYLDNYLKFKEKLKKEPKIFGVNYFLKDKNGKYLNEKTDKAVWLKWMELRIHGDVDAIKTPIGYIPKYEDLKDLFKKVQKKDYSLNDYEEQFKIRVPELISKCDRILEIYRKIPTVPEKVIRELEEEKKRLIDAREKFGDYISPLKFY